MKLSLLLLDGIFLALILESLRRPEDSPWLSSARLGTVLVLAGASIGAELTLASGRVLLGALHLLRPPPPLGLHTRLGCAAVGQGSLVLGMLVGSPLARGAFESAGVVLMLGATLGTMVGAVVLMLRSPFGLTDESRERAPSLWLLGLLALSAFGGAMTVSAGCAGLTLTAGWLAPLWSVAFAAAAGRRLVHVARRPGAVRGRSWFPPAALMVFAAVPLGGLTVPFWFPPGEADPDERGRPPGPGPTVARNP